MESSHERGDPSKRHNIASVSNIIACVRWAVPVKAT